MELKGKVAVITGASSGIGEGTARELANAGMKLVLTARRKELLDKIAAQLDTEVAIIAGDITDESLPQKLIDRAVGTFGSCDVVANVSAEDMAAAKKLAIRSPRTPIGSTSPITTPQGTSPDLPGQDGKWRKECHRRRTAA